MINNNHCQKFLPSTAISPMLLINRSNDSLLQTVPFTFQFLLIPILPTLHFNCHAEMTRITEQLFIKIVNLNVHSFQY